MNFLKLSRLRHIETKEFSSCRDRDSARPENLLVVETETHRDWTKVVETETLTRLFQKVLRNSTGWPLDKMKRNQTNIYCSNFDLQKYLLVAEALVVF